MCVTIALPSRIPATFGGHPSRTNGVCSELLWLLCIKIRWYLYGCGIMRTNWKGFPELLKHHAKTGLAVMGDSITVQHKENKTTVSLCQDSRPVIVIANNTDGTVTETVKRMKKNGTREIPLAHHSLHTTTGLWQALIATIKSEDTTTLLSSAGNATSTSSGLSSMLLLQMHSFYAKSSHPWRYGQWKASEWTWLNNWLVTTMVERGQDGLALQLQPSVSAKAIFPLVAVTR